MTYLLDVNVLVALFDGAHLHHEAAHRWFAAVGVSSWATCPLTENGAIRVLTNPAYPTISVTAAEAANLLRVATGQPGHVFWNDDASLLNATRFDLSHLRGHQQITDVYLAGLAASRGGRLATFDASIPVAAVIAAPADLVELISLP